MKQECPEGNKMIDKRQEKQKTMESANTHILKASTAVRFLGKLSQYA